MSKDTKDESEKVQLTEAEAKAIEAKLEKARLETQEEELSRYWHACSYCGGWEEVSKRQLSSDVITGISISFQGLVREVCEKCLIITFDKVLGRPRSVHSNNTPKNPRYN